MPRPALGHAVSASDIPRRLAGEYFIVAGQKPRHSSRSRNTPAPCHSEAGDGASAGDEGMTLSS